MSPEVAVHALLNGAHYCNGTAAVFIGDYHFEAPADLRVVDEDEEEVDDGESPFKDLKDGGEGFVEQ